MIVGFSLFREQCVLLGPHPGRIGSSAVKVNVSFLQQTLQNNTTTPCLESAVCLMFLILGCIF